MHGNENMLSQLSEGDLEALLDEIQYLYNDYFWMTGRYISPFKGRTCAIFLYQPISG